MEKTRPPLIFLHGALGVSADLSPLMTICENLGYEVFSFDFSGHGRDAINPSEFRIDLFAHDLEGFLTKNHLKSPTVFGYSMGGYVALYHKANFENSPLKMIFTYGTKFNWSAQSVRKELSFLDPEHLSEKFPLFAENLKKKHGEGWKQLLRSTAHMMQNLEKLDGLTREDLAEIDIPVFLILGDQDRMVTSEETHLAASWIPGSEVKTISHSKHELERSNLKEIAGLIEAHLEY